jgi:hypothetical protein
MEEILKQIPERARIETILRFEYLELLQIRGKITPEQINEAIDWAERVTELIYKEKQAGQFN